MREFFETNYYNVACTCWVNLDPEQTLASHPTRQATHVVYDDTDDDRVIDFACRWCHEKLTAS